MPVTLLSLPRETLLLISELLFEEGKKADIVGFSSACKTTRAACLPLLFERQATLCSDTMSDSQRPEAAEIRSYCRMLNVEVCPKCAEVGKLLLAYYPNITSLVVQYSVDGEQTRRLNLAVWLALMLGSAKASSLRKIAFAEQDYWEPDTAPDLEGPQDLFPVTSAAPLSLLPGSAFAALYRLELQGPTAGSLIQGTNQLAVPTFPRLETFLTDCYGLAEDDVVQFLARAPGIRKLSLRTTNTLCLTHLINVAHDAASKVNALQIIRVRGEPLQCECGSASDAVTFADLQYMAIEDTDAWDDSDMEAEALAPALVSNVLRITAEKLTHLYTHWVLSECSLLEGEQIFSHLSDKAKHLEFSTWFYYHAAPLSARGIDVTKFTFDSIPVQNLRTRFPDLPLPAV